MTADTATAVPVIRKRARKTVRVAPNFVPKNMSNLFFYIMPWL